MFSKINLILAAVIIGGGMIMTPMLSTSAAFAGEKEIVNIPDKLDKATVKALFEDGQSQSMTDTMPDGDIMTIYSVKNIDGKITTAFEYRTAEGKTYRRIVVMQDNMSDFKMFDDKGKPVTGYAVSQDGERVNIGGYVGDKGLGVSTDVASDSAIAFEMEQKGKKTRLEFANQAEMDDAVALYKKAHDGEVDKASLTPQQKEMLAHMEMFARLLALDKK